MTEDNRKKVTKIFWTVVAVPFALITGLLLLVWAFADIPSFEELEHPDSKLATQVISADGQTLTTFHIENRTYVSYEELSPYLIQAAVATEDLRFYKHSGIDFESLGRVLVKTILMSDSSQGGGSTITQQLAKTLYPRNETSGIPVVGKIQMVWIKLKEWITAIKLERDYTKGEIIDMYLNSIFFGSGAYGVKAASETFFAKAPAALTIEESAMLVGMVNKPTRYNPALHYDKALVRRNFVLGQMHKAGYISKHERDSLRELPINIDQYQVQDHNAGLAPYFRDMLRRYMNARKPRRSDYQYREDYAADSLAWADDDLYGWLNKNRKADGSSYNLDKDGLRIYTTIDSRMQKYAEEAVAEYMKTLQKEFAGDLKWNKNRPFARDVDDQTIERAMNQARRWSDRWRMGRKEGLSESEILRSFKAKRNMRVFAYNAKGYIDTLMTPDDSIRYYKTILRTAFVAMEPNSGHVKAYVGGPNYRYFKYDNVRQGKRQVGSTIKPFLYTLAMQEGLSPCYKVANVPQTFIVGDDTWTPRSTDPDKYIGKTYTLKWGLAHSSNNYSAFLMKRFGPQAMADMMRKMGISSHVDEVVSLCTGPADLSPYEMVAAYNTFPSRGVYVSPIFVTRIEDNQGNVLGEFTNHKREAISDRTAYLMENLMAGVVNSGTAAALRSVYGMPYSMDIAGKTGTTNDNSDGWFIGYTPTITAGVWVGGEDRQVHFSSLRLGGGSHMALPIWGKFMQKCLKDGSLSVSSTDRFIAPAGMDLNLDCTGGDDDESQKEQDLQDYYFE